MTADRFGLIPCAAIVLALFVGLLLVWRPKYPHAALRRPFDRWDTNKRC